MAGQKWMRRIWQEAHSWRPLSGRFVKVYRKLSETQVIADDYLDLPQMTGAQCSIMQRISYLAASFQAFEHLAAYFTILPRELPRLPGRRSHELMDGERPAQACKRSQNRTRFCRARLSCVFVESGREPSLGERSLKSWGQGGPTTNLTAQLPSLLNDGSVRLKLSGRCTVSIGFKYIWAMMDGIIFVDEWKVILYMGVTNFILRSGEVQKQAFGSRRFHSQVSLLFTKLDKSLEPKACFCIFLQFVM